MLAPILGEVRRRLASAFPGAVDRSGDPHPKPTPGLAFAAAANITDTEPLGMGDGRRLARASLAVTVWPLATAPRADTTALAHAAADAAVAAIRADPPDLAGTAWSVEVAAVDVEIAAGAERITRVDVAFDVAAIAPAP